MGGGGGGGGGFPSSVQVRGYEPRRESRFQEDPRNAEKGAKDGGGGLQWGKKNHLGDGKKTKRKTTWANSIQKERDDSLPACTNGGAKLDDMMRDCSQAIKKETSGVGRGGRGKGKPAREKKKKGGVVYSGKGDQNTRAG